MKIAPCAKVEQKHDDAFSKGHPENHEHDQNIASDCKTENQSEKVAEAALWMSLNVDSIRGNHLLEIMARFGLSVLDATEASKRGHALRYARAGQ